MTDVINEPPRAHVRIVYLGPVSPHWELYSIRDRTVLESSAPASWPVLLLLVTTRIPRNRERIVRDAERDRFARVISVPEVDDRGSWIQSLLKQRAELARLHRRVLALRPRAGYPVLYR